MTRFPCLIWNPEKAQLDHSCESLSDLRGRRSFVRPATIADLLIEPSIGVFGDEKTEASVRNRCNFLIEKGFDPNTTCPSHNTVHGRDEEVVVWEDSWDDFPISGGFEARLQWAVNNRLPKLALLIRQEFDEEGWRRFNPLWLEHPALLDAAFEGGLAGLIAQIEQSKQEKLASVAKEFDEFLSILRR